MVDSNPPTTPASAAVLKGATADENTRLREWFTRAARAYQEAEAELSEAVRSLLQDISSFSAPCQLWVFAVQNPGFYTVLVTHAPSDEPLQVHVHGPIPRVQFHTVAVEALRHPGWDHLVQTPSYFAFPTRPRYLWEDGEGALSAAWENLRNLTFNARETTATDMGGQRSVFSTGGFHAEFLGDPLLHDPIAWGVEGIREAQARWEHEQSLPKIPTPPQQAEREAARPERPPHGFAIILRPKVFLGLPMRSPGLGWPRYLHHTGPGRPVLEGKLAGSTFMATHDGYVALAEPDLERATRAFQSLSLAIRARALPVQAAEARDLLGFRLSTPGTWKFEMWTVPDRLDTDATLWAGLNSSHNPWLGQTDFEGAVRLADELSAHPLFADLWWLHRAESHLREKEWDESFLYSWAVIEPACRSLYRTILQVRPVSKGRLDRLTERDAVERVIEGLELMGAIDAPTYASLGRLRQETRNKLFHHRHDTTSETARLAFEIGKNLLLRSPDAPSLPLNGNLFPD